MKLRVRDLVGLPGIPATSRGLRDWLKKQNLPLAEDGNYFTFLLSDLPDEVRIVYQVRQAERAGLVVGMQDDAAHLDLAQKPVGVQGEGFRRAKIMTFIARHKAQGLAWKEISGLILSEFEECPDAQTVKNWSERIQGIDPINWAPALAPHYKGRTATAPISEEGWQEFCAKIDASGRNGTGVNFKRLWKQVRETAAKVGCTQGCRCDDVTGHAGLRTRPDQVCARRGTGGPSA